MDLNNIQEIYSLSFLQKAVLLRALDSNNFEGHCNQFCCEIRGNLNISAFETAWQKAVERHTVLRTFFVWKSLDNPHQVIQKQLKLKLEQQDWRCLSPVLQQERYSAFLKSDRERGFKPSAAPLMRLTLCQTAEDVHQLVCTYHRSILDDWSLDLILKQVFAYYERYCQGRELQLEDSIPYRNYITWLKRQDLSKAEAFWREALQGVTAPTPLVVSTAAADRLSNQKQSYNEQQRSLSASMTTSLQSVARLHDLTLNTLIQGAWVLLLSRYSGQEDVIYGITDSFRSLDLQGANSLVGPLTNTLPARVRVFPDVPVLAWLKDLQTQQANLRQYGYCSLVQVQKWSGIPNELPLFTSSFVDNSSIKDLIKTQFGSINLDNIQTLEQIDCPLVVKTLLHQNLILNITYDDCYFDRNIISQILEQMQTLLEEMVAHPEKHVSQLPLLNAAAQRKLLVEWNDTKTDYLQNQCIHEIFEAQVERTPDAIALDFEDKHITYRDLNCRANQLAHYLRSLGVGPEVLVAICMERSLETIVGLLGILKAGGAYVPLDPTYPFERLSFMLEDAQPPVLLTQEHLIDVLPSHWAYVVCLDTTWETISQEQEENPNSGATAKNLAYVIYTSGSTGTPKGVLVPHQGLCNLAQAQIQLFDVQPNNRILQFASLSFDASIWEVIMALCSGAKLCLGTQDSLLPGADLIQFLRRQAITHVTLPPTALAAMPTEELPHLQTIIVAGEACPPDLASQWSKNRRFFNAYGPTESTICATVAESTVMACAKGSSQLPIGRPIANTQVYILDRNLQPVPIGVPGELYISGVGLARGYLNQPELTLERFIPNPFSNEPETCFYKTGDLARYLADGNIEFLGRLDHQVKIRGYRIELGEIEAVLAQHPAVRLASVIAREDHPDKKRLVAYIVPEQEPGVTPCELRQFLKDKLPCYMVPSAFMILEFLPLTPNGKVDRRALPAPDELQTELELNFSRPRNRTEEILATIWSEVLGLKQVGIQDNFFELGGDSILSIQVVTRAKEAGLLLAPKQLFQHQTIAELAAVADINLPVQAEQGLVTGAVPLTPFQQWFFEQDLPEPQHCNRSVLLELPLELKPELLRPVVQELLAHHDALRLRFVPDGNCWKQFNAAYDETVPFSIVDFSEIAVDKQQAALETAAAQLQTSLDLSEKPLMRAALFYMGFDRPNRLLLVVHHLAVDSFSWQILLEDLATAYQQLSQGEAIQLPPKTTSFKDWANRLVEHGQSDAAIAELDDWLNQSWSNVVSLPVDYPFGKEANTLNSTAQVSIALRVEDTSALLEEVPFAYNTQIHDVLLTALVHSFSKWTGQYSLLIDLQQHGREEPFEDMDLSRTVGCFTTLFPILLKLEEADDLEKALKSIKEQLRLLLKRGMSYGFLRYLSQDEGTRLKLQALPQAEISFHYLDPSNQLLSIYPPLGLAEAPSRPNQSLLGSRPYLLEVSGFVVSGKLQMDWRYSENVHQRSTIEWLAQEFMETLKSLIAHCQSPATGAYTPSDFPKSGLNQQDLDELLAEID